MKGFLAILLLAILALAHAAENPTMKSDLAAVKKIIGTKTYDQVKWKQSVKVVAQSASAKPQGTVVMISQCSTCPNGFKATVQE